MKNKFLATLLAMGITGWSLACDVCGCSAGAMSSGWINAYNINSIGVGFLNQSYRSAHPTLFEGEEQTFSYESFNTIYGQFKYFPQKNIQLSGLVPYHRFQRSENHLIESNDGLGDAQLGAHLVLGSKSDSTSSTFQRFAIGGSIKLPTGQHEKRNDAQLLNPNLQLGTGSFDFPISASYFLKAGAWGTSAEAIYQINTANDQAYQFGNRFRSNVSLMRWVHFSDINKWMRPSIKCVFEHYDQDISHISRGEINPYSGGSIFSGAMDIMLRLERLLISASCQFPLSQNLAGGLINTKTRYQVEINYIINKKQ